MVMAAATHEISLRSGVLNIALPTACGIGEPVVGLGNRRSSGGMGGARKTSEKDDPSASVDRSFSLSLSR